MKRPRIVRSQPNEPLTIPQPGKMPEIEPFHDPTLPKVYPDENPIEKPQHQPTETPPYQVPKPNEFP
jgi:hypothetical protein